MISLKTKIYLISIILLIIFFIIFICIYLYIRRWNKNRQTEIILHDQQPICSLSQSTISNHCIFPSNIELSSETYPQYSLKEIPSNYKTFDLTKRSRQYHSSDSSYENSINQHIQSYSFGTIKSKLKQIHSISSQHSDIDDDIDNEFKNSLTPSSFEYSLLELFRIELIYKLSYSNDTKQLNFEILHLIPIQSLIEQCFSSLICQICLFSNNDKYKRKKYLTKINPINELFQFDLDENQLEKSYLKIYILGNYLNNKRIELGQTVLVINQYEHLNNHLEQYKKFIQIYEERIDMIIREQAKNENEARALICLVYENDRCLLHVGLIKILGLQYLLKQPMNYFHHRDQIQIKISTLIDGKMIGKKKSKFISIINGICTFNTSFHFDYISLHKISICITILYRRSLISSHNKPISIIEFGSTQLKNQQTFQHWTDTLSLPNRPHVHWHILEPIKTINEN